MLNLKQKNMKIHRAYLVVIPPSFPMLEQEWSNESRALFKISSLLQGILGGMWEIQNTGYAIRQRNDLWETVHQELLQIDLRKCNPSELEMLLVHFQFVEHNSSETLFNKPAITFDVQGSHEDSPIKLEIGATKIGNRVEVIYTFK